MSVLVQIMSATTMPIKFVTYALPFSCLHLFFYRLFLSVTISAFIYQPDHLNKVHICSHATLVTQDLHMKCYYNQ